MLGRGRHPAWAPVAMEALPGLSWTCVLPLPALQISLLDPKKILNLGIFLKQFKR